MMAGTRVVMRARKIGLFITLSTEENCHGTGNSDNAACVARIAFSCFAAVTCTDFAAACCGPNQCATTSSRSTQHLTPTDAEIYPRPGAGPREGGFDSSPSSKPTSARGCCSGLRGGCILLNPGKDSSSARGSS
jgi:hypothetical protein